VTSFPDGGELGELLAQMQHLQQSVEEAEAAASARFVEGSAADGAVRIQMSGEFSVDRVVIDASVVDPHDVGLLEDLVLAAARDAVTRLTAVRRDAMGEAVQSALADLLGAGDEGNGVQSALADLLGAGDEDEDATPGIDTPPGATAPPA
jgi:DNA-binding YbaB/EbfC family protein